MKLQDYNPFITIRELFGILLPGAMITIGCMRWFTAGKDGIIEVLTINEKANSFLLGLVFLLVSYFFGHLVFQVGSLLDDFVYDPLKDYFFKQERLKLVVKRRNDLFKREYRKKLNNFDWSLSRLRELNYKGYYNEVEAIIADAKFFRAISIISFLGVFFFSFYLKIWISLLFLSIILIYSVFIVLRIYPYRKYRNSDKKQRAYSFLWKKYGRWIIGFYIFFVLSIVGHAIYYIVNFKSFDQRILAPILISLLTIISLYFYFILRQKSCKKLYTYILFIDRKLHPNKTEDHEKQE